MAISLNTRQTTLNWILSGLLFSALLGTGFALKMQLTAQSWVDHTLEVRTSLMETLSTLQDAETGQRGFALSGDSRFLEPFTAAQQQLDPRLKELQRSISDNPVQLEKLDRLRTLAVSQLSALDAAIRRTDGQMSAAFGRDDLLQSLHNDKKRMDAARGVIAEMLEEEARLLDRRNGTLRWAVASTSAGVYGALLCAGFLGWANIRDRQRQVAELRSANAALHGALEKVDQEAERREQVEAQLRQAQKMEAVGQLTGGIAHDVNNMLAVIVGCLNLLKRKIARGEMDMEHLIDKANESIDRTAKLTHSLLAFSRQQPLAPQMVDINKIVAHMSEVILRTLGSGLKVETVLASGLWRAHADPHQLESALLNLAVNARDAMMPDGGKLTIETGNAYLDDEYALQHAEVRPGQYALIAITDSGTGISPELILKVFDPFFTTKGPGKGTGLGLSQVYGFVKQSGGHIKIYSELGHGTTVKLYLPRYIGEGEVGPRRESAPSEPFRGSPDILVLIVEDDERMRGVTIEMVGELGYTVIAADNPLHALALIDAHPNLALVFTDIVMPDMSGGQLADEALRRRPNLKVVFTTGFTRNAVIHQGVLDPGVHFLPKPFSIDQLGKTFGAALKQGPA